MAKKKRRSIPGPRKGPASKMYHFNIIPKNMFNDFRVLDKKKFGHVYGPDLEHARQKFGQKFGFDFPAGTKIVVGKFKRSAPKYTWTIGKKGERLAWGIHKILMPYGFPVIPGVSTAANPIPVISPIWEKAKDWMWGKDEPEPEVIAPVSSRYPLTLIYEIYSGDSGKPQSRIYSYGVFETGISFENAARTYVKKLKWMWDDRRIESLGVISITLVYFDPEKKEYFPFLVRGKSMPVQTLSQLIGKIPRTGVGPESQMIPFEDLPLSMGPPIISPTSYEQSKKAGFITEHKEPRYPDVMQTLAESKMPTEAEIAAARAAQARAQQRGAPSAEPIGGIGEARSQWESAMRNPALQIETNPLALHLHGDAGRLGAVNLWGSLDEYSAAAAVARKIPPRPPIHKAPMGPMPRIRPVKDLTEPAEPISIVSPSETTEQLKERLEDSLESPIVAMPSASQLESDIAAVNDEFENWYAKEQARVGGVAANRRKKSCKRNPRKTKKTYKTSTLPGWKKPVVACARRQPARWLALTGYLTDRVLTSPKHITGVKVKAGRLVIKSSDGKTESFGTLAETRKWWQSVTGKLSKSEKAAADRVFKRKIK